MAGGWLQRSVWAHSSPPTVEGWRAQASPPNGPVQPQALFGFLSIEGLYFFPRQTESITYKDT